MLPQPRAQGKFYNKGECKNGDKCEFLHVCEHYVKGDCKFGEKKCKRSHHFGTSHSRKVLASHNLGNLRNERQILSFLTSASRGGFSVSQISHTTEVKSHHKHCAIT